MTTAKIFTRKEIKRLIERELNIQLKAIRNQISELQQAVLVSKGIMDGESLPDDYELKKIKMPERAQNCFHNHGITTVGKLKSMTRSDLLKIRNLGNHTLDLVVAIMATHGVELSL